MCNNIGEKIEMSKKKPSLQAVGLQPYRGQMKAVDTATAIQAARLNAKDLLQTAKMLFKKKQYNHSLAFSILAIEEAGKSQILIALFLGIDGPLEKHWSAYRHHTSKTVFFNFAIQARAQTVFPNIDQRDVDNIGTAGPSPEEMDAVKQLCFYSDCFASLEGPSVHLPKNVDRREQAECCLTEASVLINYLRDYPPEELEIWDKHVSLAKKKGLGLNEVLKPLQDELLQKGFIKDGQWAPILEACNELAMNPVNESE